MKKLVGILVAVVVVATVVAMISLYQQEESISYETAYAQAVEMGFEGSLDDFIEVLQGEKGESAYEIAVKNCFEGSEEDWLNSAHQNSIGDTMIIVGNAAGLGTTASTGILSDTPQLYDVEYMDDLCEAVRTDSAVNPGNSGGGLFNSQGQLIGIVTFKLLSPYESLGFALTTDFAIEYINEVENQKSININYVEV